MSEADEASKASSGEIISCPSNESSSSSDKSKVVHKMKAKQTHEKSSSEKIDRFLSLYCKWTASSTLTERGIKMLQWTAWLLSQLTKDKYKILSPCLRKLYSDLSIMRYVLRLYGIPTAIEGIRSGSRSGGTWKDKRIKLLGNVMAWSMAAYYPLEHIAWAKWTMPQLMPKVDGNRFSAWSCRFWMVFIIAEMTNSVLKNKELGEELRSIDKRANDSDDSEAAISKSNAIEKSMHMNRLQIMRDILFTGPCINWSLDEWATNPWLSENWCNGISFTEALTCMYQSVYSLQNN